MKIIQLTRGEEALVSDEDFERVSRHKWQADPNHSGYFYAKRHKGDSRKSGRKKIYMHRDIMNPSKGMVVDHRNGNGLDNTRENLRVVTVEVNNNNHEQHRKQKEATNLAPDPSWDY